MNTFPFVDTSVRPQDDFYRFVNGKWLDTVEIPQDRSSWGSFYELIKSTDKRLHDLLKEELDKKGESHNLAARLFESGMDVNKIERLKLKALQPIFDLIRNVNSHEELPILFTELCAKGVEAFISFGVFPDMVNSKIYHGYLEPAHLGLPERDMYLNEDDKSKEVRSEYVKFVASILVDELDYDKAEAHHIGQTILDMETDLAKIMMSKEDKRQVEKIYHPHTYNAFKEVMSTWNIDHFLQSLIGQTPDEIIVTEPEYYSFLNTNLTNYPINLIKAYLQFRAVLTAAPFANESLDLKRFTFYEKYLQGVPEIKPRVERVIKIINTLVGESLGQLYVSKWFPSEAKESAIQMTKDVIKAFENRIKKLTWMSDETKVYAIEKLNAMTIKIGYPDNWETYEGMNISSDDENISYLHNVMEAQAWMWKRDISRFRKEVDKSEWFMAPQVVNAYYHPLYNEIVFPAAILQPPFFHHQADHAVNYGGIGAVIGHEITHGFDDQGSRFDKEGNFYEWWTEVDRQKFVELTGKVIEQADAYYPLEDMHINGTFTLGENIADLGGLSVAYDALMICHERENKPDTIEGFTPEQRYFMSWATVWRTKIRTEALRMQIQTDPHPPGSYRAIAAPGNLDAFYQAFNISTDDKHYRSPDQRVKVW